MPLKPEVSSVFALSCRPPFVLRARCSSQPGCLCSRQRPAGAIQNAGASSRQSGFWLKGWLKGMSTAPGTGQDRQLRKTHGRGFGRQRRSLVALLLGAGMALSACSLDQETEVRSQIAQWVSLGDTLYFYSRVNCTAALFDIKATRITSMIKKARTVEAGMRSIEQGQAVAFEIAGMSPNRVSETIMTENLPQGLGVLSSGIAGRACMAQEMEVAYFNALLDPTSVMIFEPQEKFMGVFDRRNRRLFYSRGRAR